jgi:hypothetical protein
MPEMSRRYMYEEVFSQCMLWILSGAQLRCAWESANVM